MNADCYPLCLAPVYQDYPWGGDAIIRRYQRQAPPGIYAESWEVSDRAEGMSVVCNGPLAGRTLAEVITLWGGDLLGTAVAANRFPLLIKLLDARETLSVQVHPDDQTAARHGGEAKTEMWYVLEAAPDAAVYAGLKHPIDPATFRQRAKDGTLEPLLNRVPVRPGDAVFMPGGRVHAIGAGCLLLEVQQNSDTTYRIYDWGRMGYDGKPRALHLDEALAVIDWTPVTEALATARRLDSVGRNERWEVLDSPWFRMERLDLREQWPLSHDGSSFQVIFVADAPLRLVWEGQSLDLAPGTSCLIPAALTTCQLVPQHETAWVLRITA